MRNCKYYISFVLLCYFFVGCSPGELFGPTISPTSTHTLTFTLTPSSTSTPTPTFTPSSTPTATPGPLSWDNADKIKLLFKVHLDDPPDRQTIHNLAFSSDGKYLGVASDSTVEVWEVSSGTLIQSFSNEYGSVGIGFSPDGSTLGFSFAYLGGPFVVFVDMDNWEMTIPYQAGKGTFGSFSPDGLIYAVYINTKSKTGTVEIRRSSDYSLITTLISGAVNELEFSPDGKYLAIGQGWEPKVRIFNTSDWSLEKVILYSGLSDMAFSPDSKYIACMTNEFKAIILSAGDWEELIQISVSGSAGIAFTIDSQYITDSFRFYNIFTGAYSTLFNSNWYPVFAFSPDGKTISIGYNWVEILGIP
jgi:WD40 repeat protein